jgi:hypothetical protein
MDAQRSEAATKGRWRSRKVSHRRAAPFRSRLCGRRFQRCRTLTRMACEYSSSALSTLGVFVDLRVLVIVDAVVLAAINLARKSRNCHATQRRRGRLRHGRVCAETGSNDSVSQINFGVRRNALSRLAKSKEQPHRPRCVDRQCPRRSEYSSRGRRRGPNRRWGSCACPGRAPKVSSFGFPVSCCGPHQQNSSNSKS